MLPLVSDNVILDDGKSEPKFPKTYDVAPPANFADLMLFTHGQPYDAYKTLRETAPVCWHEEMDGSNVLGSGFWAVTRYEDVKAVDLNPKVFSSQLGGINMNYGAEATRHPDLHPAALNNIICLDQPLHLPLRREHMAFFTPGYTQALRTRVDVEIDRLLDEVENAGPTLDMVEHFSAKLPLFTLCEILGVPNEDRPKLIEWMHVLENIQHTLALQSLEEVDPLTIMSAMTTISEMFTYGREILSDRRENPREDLLTAIARAQVDGDFLPERYLDGSWLLIIFAGNDTTRNSLSGTMRLLTEFPDQKEKLLANPDLTPGMVDEAIRMVSPVMYMRRTATEDTEVNGQKIGEGEKVIMYYGAANRDDAVFADPDRFDIERANAKDHIAFGTGPHVCLGQRTANMQLEAAYRKILARFPKITWTGEVEMAPNNFVHAISKLNISLNG